MRIALAQNGYKAKYERLESKPFGICADHSFSCELGRSIERSLEWEWRVFRCREDAWLAIYGTRRSKRHPSHAAQTHCFEHIVRGNRILFQVAIRMRGAEPNVRVRRKVEDEILTVHAALQSGTVEKISLFEPESRMCQRPFEETQLTS